MSSAFTKPPELPDEEKQFQLEQQQEQELKTLAREYDVLDRERTRYLFAGFSKLNKTAKLVSIFKNEHENILTDLEVATGTEKTRDDRTKFEQLADLLHEYDVTSQLTEARKMNLQELDNQIKETHKSVKTLGKKQMTDRNYEDLIHAATQTVETLENKLDAQMKKFNVIVAENVQLRNNIDHLMLDRQNFMTVWKKLIDKLNTGKHIMLDLIEQASIAYDQREDWCTKLQMLRISGHKDFTSNIDQMRAYQHRVANAMKLEEFFNTKGQKRLIKDLYRKETLKRIEQKEKLETKLASYRQMMADIEDFTEKREVAVIAKDYCYKEAENFANFRYIIDLIGETELVNDHLGFLNFDIDEQTRLYYERAEQQKMTLLHLEEELKAKKGTTQIVKEELEDVNSHLNEIMDGISTLFKICGCSQDPLLQLLDNNSTIERYNVLLYLQILEKAVHERLIRAAYKTHLTAERKSHHFRIFSDEIISSKIYGIDQIVVAHPCSLCVEHEMVTEVFDAAERPWPREEVLQRLKHRLKQPDAHATVHSISKCHLPKARRVIQQRYM